VVLSGLRIRTDAIYQTGVDKKYTPSEIERPSLGHHPCNRKRGVDRLRCVPCGVAEGVIRKVDTGLEGGQHVSVGLRDGLDIPDSPDRREPVRIQIARDLRQTKEDDGVREVPVQSLGVHPGLVVKIEKPSFQPQLIEHLATQHIHDGCSGIADKVNKEQPIGYM
jgi:hypothetical protein